MIARLDTFLLGIGGSFTAYFALYRESRFRDFFTNPREHWNTFLFDLFFFLTCGGLVATYLVEAHNVREAFMAGISWQGLVGGVLAGNELKNAQQTIASQRTQKRRPS